MPYMLLQLSVIYSRGEILMLFTTDLELEYSLLLQTAQE